MTATTTWDVLNRAHGALLAATAGVAEKDWTLATPCASWNVTQVLQHAAGDQLAYVAAITGGGGPAEDPFEPSGVLTGDPVAFVQTVLDASAAAWSTVAQGARDVPTPLPQGAMDAGTAVGACALDAAVHAWDMAVATGQPSPLDPGLAARLARPARAVVEPLRAYGAYAAALDPRPGDDDAAALLRYLGRDPGYGR